MLRAVAWHTVGNVGFGQLGRALYAADFLEPGRPFLPEWRAGLRSRMPHELDEVVFEIVQARLLYRIEMGAPMLPETLEFWNRLAEERS